MLDDLVKLALIGTARGGATPQPPEGALGDALAALPPAPGPEAALLRAAAMGTAYEACGRIPAKAPAPPPPAPPDVRPPCSPRAADLLGQVLAMSNTPGKLQLLIEWLDAAARAGQRAPHAALPALLDHAAAHRAVQDQIALIIDERGRWLASQNPKWQPGSVADQDVQSAWSTGTPAQRLAALRRARRDDPAAARAMVQSTWKEDGADERAAFVTALSDGLSPEDEPFLESALDDRSKQVRAAAAELLARLPGSAYVARMVERADAMVRLKGKRIDVTLPTKFDPTWARDGITEKPTQRIGQKQWWLQQIVAAVPPSHWSISWKLDPAACIKAAAGDFDGVLTEAWSLASQRHRDEEWIIALLQLAVREKEGQLRIGLLDALPEAKRVALLVETLNKPRLPITDVAELLRTTQFPLDKPAALALVAYIDRYVDAAKPAYDYILPQILADLALRAPPVLYDHLAAHWAGPFWEANAKSLEQFLQTLQVRRDVQREFSI